MARETPSSAGRAVCCAPVTLAVGRRTTGLSSSTRKDAQGRGLGPNVPQGSDREPGQEHHSALPKSPVIAAQALQLELAVLQDHQRSPPLPRVIGMPAPDRDRDHAELRPRGRLAPEQRKAFTTMTGWAHSLAGSPKAGNRSGRTNVTISATLPSSIRSTSIASGRYPDPPASLT